MQGRQKDVTPVFCVSNLKSRIHKTKFSTIDLTENPIYTGGAHGKGRRADWVWEGIGFSCSSTHQTLTRNPVSDPPSLINTDFCQQYYLGQLPWFPWCGGLFPLKLVRLQLITTSFVSSNSVVLPLDTTLSFIFGKKVGYKSIWGWHRIPLLWQFAMQCMVPNSSSTRWITFYTTQTCLWALHFIHWCAYSI